MQKRMGVYVEGCARVALLQDSFQWQFQTPNHLRFNIRRRGRMTLLMLFLLLVGLFIGTQAYSREISFGCF